MTTSSLGQVKRAAKKLLGRFGYQISRAEAAIEPFSVQRALVRADAPTVFDVGAYTGQVANKYRGLWPQARIHCFEPFPDSFRELSANTAADPLIFRHETAVSDKKGKAALNVNASLGTNSLLATDKQGAEYWGTGILETKAQVEVPTTTLDDFCRERSISHVDILKIDVQGAEFAVFAGAKSLLEKQQISLIYCELIVCPTYATQRRLYEYLSVLEGVGYEMLDFYSPLRSRHQLLQVDAIFLSSSFKRSVGLG